MRRRRADIPSLVAGLAALLVGLFLLLDRAGALDLRFGWLWPLLLVSGGAVLLATGLAGRRR